MSPNHAVQKQGQNNDRCSTHDYDYRNSCVGRIVAADVIIHENVIYWKTLLRNVLAVPLSIGCRRSVVV